MPTPTVRSAQVRRPGGQGGNTLRPGAAAELVRTYGPILTVLSASWRPASWSAVAPLLRGRTVTRRWWSWTMPGNLPFRFSPGIWAGQRTGGRCAFLTGARAVITTATDVNGLPSFDMLAKENGWGIEDISRVKTLNSLLLDDEKIAVVDDTGLVRSFFHGRGNLQFIDSFVAGASKRAQRVSLCHQQHHPAAAPLRKAAGASPEKSRPRHRLQQRHCCGRDRRGRPRQPEAALSLPASIAAWHRQSESRAGLPSSMRRGSAPLRAELNGVPPSPPHARAAASCNGVAEPAPSRYRLRALLLERQSSGNVPGGGRKPCCPCTRLRTAERLHPERR